LIGVEDYGYWQLYLFYASYIGFLHFGWNDGIYLRYGGAEYEKLDKSLFFSQFYMLLSSQTVIAIIIYALSTFFVENADRAFIFSMVALSLLITNMRWMLVFTLQATNRIKEYAGITVIGRVLYVLIIIALLIMGYKEYKLMIVADIIARFVSLMFAIYTCRDFIFRKISNFYFSFKEMAENISAGSKLMFATIASMLIIGVVRFGIERTWDVSTFGKVSLTLSASNMLMLFINAVGIVVFPILRRTNERNLPEIYTTMRDFLMLVLLGLLIIYHPVKEILSAWLPKYADSLRYMALLFPICVYEGKMALLINTYLKTLRKETLMLKINVISLLVSFVTTFIFSRIFHELNILIVSIVFLLGFRSILAEILLSRILKVSLLKDIILEVVMTIIFVCTGWFIMSWTTILIYGFAYILYLVIKKKDLKMTVSKMKGLIKK
jgi:O-antigen/teichoic acid export membrane protein